MLAYFKNFFERNIFERIVLYIFMADFLVQVIFEICLGYPSHKVSRQVQWVFFGLLGLEYLISWQKVVRIRISLNPMSIMAFVFIFMVLHGLTMGLLNGNKPFEILNDTVPLLMIALNVLRMQSFSEERKIDFMFLLKACSAIAATSCFLGAFANTVIGHSTPLIPGREIYIALLVTALFVVKPFPKWIALLGAAMLVLGMGDFNRTSMAFLGFVGGVGLLFKVITKPLVGFVAVMLAIIALALAVHFVPENSKTYNRVVGLVHLDLSKRTGSVGERQAEWDAIQLKLTSMGRTIELFGLGFGGVYDVARTHSFIKDYGHAHYSWAWFNLRFGQSGYIYLAAFVMALFYNFIAGVRCYKSSKTGLWVGLTCLECLIYCITYVNAVFLMSGVPFLSLYRDMDKENDALKK